MAVNIKTIKSLVQSILRKEKRDGEVSVVFVDDNEIERLNRRYRKMRGPTDVLAFPGDKPIVGDIVISTDTAIRQAVSLGHPIEDELSFLLIHGTLHLLGYDHHKPKERKLMFKKQAYYQSC